MRNSLLSLLLFTQLLACGSAELSGAETADESALLSDFISMKIVAHEDDDFLFMNPDLADQINAGAGSVTVYLTAGQASWPTEQQAQTFAAGRQQGVQAAYAQMANVADVWDTTILWPDGAHQIEMRTLIDAPRIRLIFMNLPDGGDEHLDPVFGVSRSYGINNMFEVPGFMLSTLTPDGTIVPRQTYDRSGVVAVLSGLLSMFHPTVVMSTDPMPLTNGYIHFDNVDHKDAASFANEALANYHDRYTLLNYRGYTIENFPENLGYAARLAKRATGEAYRPHDPNYGVDQYDNYYRRMYERYPASTRWLEKLSDGRLAAFTVEDRQIVMRYETSAGGAWSSSTVLTSGDPIAPHLTVLKRPDGNLQIVALRLPLGREHGSVPAGTPDQEVITAAQTGAGPTFGAWTSLGNPDGGAFTGVPSAAIDGASRLFVFVRSSSGTISWRRLDSSWTALSAVEPIIDGIAAITRNDGRVEGFATSLSGRVQHFYEFPYSTSIVYDTLSFPQAEPITDASSAPTVTKNGDGRLEIFYREAGTGRVKTVYEISSGYWSGQVLLYGDAGVGPVAAIRRESSGHIMLFERNVWSGISATWQINANDIFGLQWVVLGGFLYEYPSAVTDGNGRVALMVKGLDGRLYMQREGVAIGSFGPWVAIDSIRPPRRPIRFQ